ncbi:MAG: hypothetical protein EXX96DRAFT_577467 [Benjaminiella poitrasii]|nr:MAG: hypothetical protein EXX96DRAFT_577467 [Benjaminiella poitrasii]
MNFMDINAKIDKRYATVWVVDPGMNDIYFASNGDCDKRHRIRRTGKAEYYSLCGFNSATKRRNMHANSNLDAIRVLNQMPTPKTVDPTNLITSVRYILQNYTIITGYLEHRTLRRSKWKAYVSKQKGLREVCDRPLCNSIKYGSLVENERVSRPNKWTSLDPIDNVADHNRPIVIAYRNADFRASMSGTIFGPNKLIRKRLQELVKERNKQIPTYLCFMDEYYTSQVYPGSSSRTLRKASDYSGEAVHPVLWCASCITRWNRDYMSSMKIRNIFMYMAGHSNSRPSTFARSEGKT